MHDMMLSFYSDERKTWKKVLTKMAMNIVRQMPLNAYILYDQITAHAPHLKVISRFQFTQHVVDQLASRGRGQRRHRAPNAIHMLLLPNK